MKKVFFTILSFAYALLLSAQTTAKFYVELNNGEKIYSNSTPSFKKKQLIIDSVQKFSEKDVKSFLGSDGYFQRIMNKKKTKVDWYRLEMEGKINILSKQSIVDNSYYDGTNYVYSAPYLKKEYYFQDEPFTANTINYENLVNKISSNPMSLALLNKGKRLSNTKTTLIAVGAVLTIAGCLMGKTEKLDNGNKNFIPSPVALVGLGTCFVPLFIKNPKAKYQQAIEIYNRN